MKQTFYLHRWSNGDVLISDRSYIKGLCFMGKTELDVQPIKKEVEKVFECKQFERAGFSWKYFNFPVPVGAYDVKVVYKVKE
jgi:hypothetical protein